MNEQATSKLLCCLDVIDNRLRNTEAMMLGMSAAIGLHDTAEDLKENQQRFEIYRSELEEVIKSMT